LDRVELDTMSLQDGNPQYIGGAWAAANGQPIEVHDPTTGGVSATIGTSSVQDVESALTAARDAQRSWGALPPVQRGSILRAMADVIDAHADDLAKVLVGEVGKPLAQARGEIGFAATFLRYNAEWDRRLEGEILAGDVSGEVIHLLRSPVGVVAAICPWNFPLAVFCRKVGPALLTGNTVVAKPSEVAPLTILEAVRLFDEEVALPPGVLNLVIGGPAVGAALVDSPLTSLVSFTGHRDTGKAVMAAASRNLTRVSLELGGKAPAIVWSDADLGVAVPAIVAARHTNAGQVCTSAERVFVHEAVLDPFVERYTAAVRALRIGNPLGDVDLGPLVSSMQLEKTRAAVATAIEEGAVVVAGGDRPAGHDFADGYWFEPTVLRDVGPEMSVMIEETFGPVTPIMGIGSLEEALEAANDSNYGLSAYIYSRDYGTIMHAVDALQFGELYINRTLGESVHAHHAGFKQSGIGGEDGKWGILRYTQIKTAYHHYGAPAG
jgi:lactaldehyde dehydrogenase / glycolaldehyde dehydrogenase